MPRGYDLGLGDPDDADYLGLMLYEDKQTPKGLRSTFVPAATTGGPVEDVVQADWSNGLGYSQPGPIENGYSYGEFVDTRTGAVLPAGELTELTLPASIDQTVEINGAYVLGGHLFVISTRYLFKLANLTGAPQIVYDYGSETFDGSAAVVRYNGNQIAYMGRTNGFFAWNGSSLEGDTNTFTGRCVTPVYWTTTSGQSVQRLVAANGDYTIRHCPLTANPGLDASWSSSITVGEGAHRVMSMASAGRHVYISTRGGVYDLNELEETLALTPYHNDLADDENGLNCRFYDRFVMYQHVLGTDAIDVSTPGLRHAQPNFVTPGAEALQPNETPIWGRTTAACHDGGWYVQAVFNGRDSYVIYGKPRDRLGVPGTTPWVWHGALAKFSNAKVSMLKPVSVATGGRSRYLYIGIEDYSTGGEVPRLYRQSLPRAISAKQEFDILNAGTFTVNHRFYPGFTLVNTPLDWGSPSRQHTLLRLDVGSENVADGRSLGVSVSEDGGTFTTVGAVTTSPHQALPTTSDAPQGQRLAVKVEATSTSTEPVILRSITARAATDLEQYEALDATVLLMKGQPLNNGGHDDRHSDSVKWLLLARCQNTIKTLTTPLDQEISVLIEGGMVSEIKQIDRHDGPTGKGWGRVVRMRMRVLDSYARYDADSLYDVDAYS